MNSTKYNLQRNWLTVGKRSAAMVAAKRLAGVAPEVNLRERISCMPTPSANKAVHSDFETQRRRHQKSKTGLSVAPQKGFMSSKNLKKKKKKKLTYHQIYSFDFCHVMSLGMLGRQRFSWFLAVLFFPTVKFLNFEMKNNCCHQFETIVYTWLKWRKGES